MLVIGLILNEKSFLNLPIFRLYGKHSLGVFLFHPVAITIARSWNIYFGNAYISWIVNYIVICAISLGIGIIMTKLFERPIQNIIKNVG